MEHARTKLEIRIVDTVEDVARVRELMGEYGLHLAHHPAGPEHFCVTGLDAELAHLPEPYVSPGCILLARVEGEPAGCVALRKLNRSEATGIQLELKRLWVRPLFRSTGLGRALIEAAIHHARTARAQAIYLDTVPSAMPEANRLYASFGFKDTEPYNNTRVPGIGFFRLNL